jgi:hypothetical protein
MIVDVRHQIEALISGTEVKETDRVDSEEKEFYSIHYLCLMTSRVDLLSYLSFSLG